MHSIRVFHLSAQGLAAARTAATSLLAHRATATDVWHPLLSSKNWGQLDPATLAAARKVLECRAGNQDRYRHMVLVSIEVLEAKGTGTSTDAPQMCTPPHVDSHYLSIQPDAVTTFIVPVEPGAGWSVHSGTGALCIPRDDAAEQVLRANITQRTAFSRAPEAELSPIAAPHLWRWLTVPHGYGVVLKKSTMPHCSVAGSKGCTRLLLRIAHRNAVMGAWDSSRMVPWPLAGCEPSHDSQLKDWPQVFPPVFMNRNH
jgi:hypothetical protein